MKLSLMILVVVVVVVVGLARPSLGYSPPRPHISPQHPSHVQTLPGHPSSSINTLPGAIPGAIHPGGIGINPIRPGGVGINPVHGGGVQTFPGVISGQSHGGVQTFPGVISGHSHGGIGRLPGQGLGGVGRLPVISHGRQVVTGGGSSFKQTRPINRPHRNRYPSQQYG